uniref:Uncharacterized protein n=1 Tax=Candidatus Kentrum sp. FM TaxID=2126340 RepID=A0A450U0E3_9GAMM|nr:MAG: hypothetical protein BECKFM1743C_GA0114222_108542 [Candidatus Kentron sp. FM]VFJ75780.1 MAG: hypothetical protein BECKFM1743A_GA0114220_108722 [Candidatus Kentron sp. FM]VFK22375.1 MAG: hypothetical protein BECKFM1743B_GA0114221_108562 [Candidatus Kentron sp. FM]
MDTATSTPVHQSLGDKKSPDRSPDWGFVSLWEGYCAKLRQGVAQLKVCNISALQHTALMRQLRQGVKCNFVNIDLCFPLTLPQWVSVFTEVSPFPA